MDHVNPSNFLSLPSWPSLSVPHRALGFLLLKGAVVSLVAHGPTSMNLP